MSARLLISYFILLIGSLKSQTLSTIFIDTVKITVDNKIIYESNQTTLKFIANNIDSKLTLYNDGIYKLNVKFAHLESKNLNYLSFSQSEFFIGDSACSLHTTSANNYEYCSNTTAEIESLRNLDFNNPNSSEKFNIKLYYRLCTLAPIDTANYAYNYREGQWIGPDRWVEKVIVSYKNDKKQGPATAYYDNGTTYNVNFNNNIADNYGQGQWKNYKSKLMYPIPNILTNSCDSTKKYNHRSFNLVRGENYKEIRRHNDISVHFDKKGVQHDSIEYHARGDFMDFSNDSLIIKSADLEVHNFYKKNTDTLHSFYKKINDGYVKIPTKDISKIYYSWEIWKQVTLQTALLSFASASIIAPLVSIQKGGFNTERYKKVALSSLGVMTLSISFGISFSQKNTC